MKSPRMIASIGLTGIAAIAALTLTGCNIGADHSKGMGDSGVRQGNVPAITAATPGQQNDPASVINFSDKYANIEFKCNGVDGVYTNTRSAGYFVVVPNDPQCG